MRFRGHAARRSGRSEVVRQDVWVGDAQTGKQGALFGFHSLSLGVVFVVIETLLRRRELSFPALTVGIGIYLPLEVVVTIAVGGVIGWLARRRLRAGPGSDEAETLARRRGVLIASGFLVGESIVGVLFAAADTLSGRSSSLVLVGPEFAPVATGLGAVVFAAIVLGFQHLVSRAPPA